MIIDIYTHYISRSVGQLVGKAKLFGDGKSTSYSMHYTDNEVRLGHMEKYGIDKQALSQSTPVLLGFGPEDAAEICRRSNDDNYDLCRAYPGRFVNICMFSLLDIKSALQELSRSVNELDCRGVTLSSNQDGKGLDSPDFFPFYEKVAEYDLPILIHPTHWKGYPLVEDENGWDMMSVFGWPFDTTQAVWRLIFGGVIDRFPTLKILMHHLGAMFPYFVGRIETTFNRKLKEKLPRPIDRYWNNIYGDTALSGSGNRAAFACGYDFFGPDRTVFGSDYPFGPEGGEKFIRGNLEGVRSMNIPPEDMKKVLWENARKLLKIT
jgi:uncharacterized protein